MGQEHPGLCRPDGRDGVAQRGVCGASSPPGSWVLPASPGWDLSKALQVSTRLQTSTASTGLPALTSRPQPQLSAASSRGGLGRDAHTPLPPRHGVPGEGWLSAHRLLWTQIKTKFSI